MRRIIEVNGRDEIHHGDVFVTNDPFYGGVTHLNDVVLALPVFAGGEGDLLLRCLATHLDGRLPAGSFASVCGTFIGGPHPDTGRHFTIVEPQVGGWGATAERDGNSAMFSGEFRGGRGIVLDYRVRSDGCFLTCAYTRNKHRPWALAGGCEGSPNYVQVIRTDGTVEEHAVVTGLAVNEGDVIRIHTGAGGGYGDPSRRRRGLVLEDVRNGFVA